MTWRRLSMANNKKASTRSKRNNGRTMNAQGIMAKIKNELNMARKTYAQWEARMHKMARKAKMSFSSYVASFWKSIEDLGGLKKISVTKIKSADIAQLA